MNKTTKRAALMLGVALTTAPALASEELTAVGIWSSVFIYQDFEFPFWSEDLSKLTDGEFTAQISSLDQMGIAGPDVYRMLGDGVFDVGATVADYAVSDAPALEGLDVPLLATTPAAARAMVDAARPMVTDIMYERFNARYLGMYPNPPQVMFCRDEVRSLADMQGKKVRGSGRMTTKFLEALGAEGVNISFSEVPGSLERGVIDCAVTGSGSGLSAGWWEVTNYLVKIPLGGWDIEVVAMNADRYDALSPEQRATLETAVLEGLEKPVWEAVGNGLEQDFACLGGEESCTGDKKASMTLIDLSPEDMEAARQVLIDVVLPDWATRAGPEWTKRWNDSVGAATGVTIAQ